MAVAGVFPFSHPADEPIHEVPAVECPAVGKAFGQGQRHRGVVRPFAGSQTKGASAHHVYQPVLLVSGFKLERRTYRVPHREPQECADRTVLDAFRGRGGQRRARRLALVHMALLVARFKGVLGTGLSNTSYRCFWTFAEFHKQPRGDGPRAAQSAFAVNEHVETEPQPVPDGRSRMNPGLFKIRSGRLSVGNRQVPPFHVPVRDRPGEILNLQVPDFCLCDQADDRCGAPPSDPFEIRVQVAFPVPCKPPGILFAGAQGDTDAAVAVLRTYRVDADGMGLACFDSIGHEPLSFRQHREGYDFPSPRRTFASTP